MPGSDPTFFLRPFFDVPQIPVYLYLHGVAGTAWFALVVIQALLIANGRFTRHRQLGWFGLGLAVVVIGLGVYTSTHMVPRNAAAHELSRIGSWGGAFAPVIITVMLGLMVSLVVHDLWTRRRVHLATVLGLCSFKASTCFQLSGIGPAIVAYRLAHL